MLPASTGAPIAPHAASVATSARSPGGAENPELADLREAARTDGADISRPESAICAYCNELVTACWLPSVTVTCRRPIAQGSPARSPSQHLHPADAPLARSVPAGRACHIVAGLPRGEIGSFPTAARQRPGPLAPRRQKDRCPYGELGPAATRTRDLLLSRSLHGRADLDPPRPQTVPSALA